MAIVCKRVVYSGRVQGVGFRFTTKRLAEGYPVAGFVRNLPTGEVELAAEGESDSVEAFLAAVARRMADYITDTTIENAVPSGKIGFQIRH
jgi:acylphosphatase